MADSKKETEAEVAGKQPDILPDETVEEIIETSEALVDAQKDGETDDTPQTPDTADATKETDEANTPDEEGEDTPDSDTDAPNEEPLADTPVETAAPADPIPVPTSAPVDQPKRAGGFLSTVFGGIIAAVIGFGAATFLFPDGLPFGGKSDTAEALKAQDQRLTTLTESLQQLTDTVATQNSGDAVAAALAKTEESLAARFDALGGNMDSMASKLETIDTRLTEVEKRPISAASDVSGAITAYERELENLRADLESQRSQNQDIAALADQAKAEIAQTTARAAMMRLRAALESGGSFTTALSDLGAEAPAALTAVADGGVATLAALRVDFPEAARAALSASLREQTGGDTGSRVGNFLRSQLGVRSLAPREGNDPDAVLSRAEAALHEGRVADALTELTALPEAGQAALADWAATAQARVDAVTAADALAAQLNLN